MTRNHKLAGVPLSAIRDLGSSGLYVRGRDKCGLSGSNMTQLEFLMLRAVWPGAKSAPSYSFHVAIRDLKAAGYLDDRSWKSALTRLHLEATNDHLVEQREVVQRSPSASLTSSGAMITAHEKSLIGKTPTRIAKVVNQSGAVSQSQRPQLSLPKMISGHRSGPGVGLADLILEKSLTAPTDSYSAFSIQSAGPTSP